METRVAKLEGGFESFRWGAQVIVGMFAAMCAIIVAITGTTAVLTWNMRTEVSTRIDRLEAKVDALPGEINRNLTELNRTLSQAITATRSSQPIVIVPPAMVNQPVPQPPSIFDKFNKAPQQQ